MRTIFISSFHQLISRNILSAPVLDFFLAEGDTRIVLVVPQKKKRFFEEAFGQKRIIVEGIDSALSRADAFFRYLALASINTRSLAIKRVADMKGSGAILTRCIGNRSFFRRVIRYFDRALISQKRFARLYDFYKPALVFSTDVQNENDVRLIVEAGERHIPVVGMVRSWDNLTAKGLIRAVPDMLLVTTDLVRREAMTLHDIPDHIIRVVGIPHYDRYLEAPLRSRQEFARGVGLDPEKRYVLYAPIGDRFLGSQNTVDKEIIKIIAEKLPPTHQLIVRFPPSDSVNLDGGEAYPRSRIVFMRPGRHLSSTPDMFKNNELVREDDEWLRDTLFYCDLVISGPSTICVDAAVFDKPAILVDFDGALDAPYHRSVRRYYDYDHMRPILQSGGVRAVRSAHELKEWMMRYLAEPEVDREGRAGIRNEQCWKLDGQSSRRLGEAVLERIAGHKAT